MDAIYDAIYDFNNNSDNIILGVFVDDNSYKNLENKINNGFGKNCMDRLQLITDSWTGIDLQRSNKIYPKFRNYFITSKNWFDQKKKQIYAKYLWLKLLKEIKEVICIINVP